MMPGIVLLAAIWATSSTTPTSVSPNPTVRFNDRTVTVSGVRPGADVLFFSVAKIPRRYDFRIVRWQKIVTDEDHDGTVSFQAETTIPITSVWAIADVLTGQVTLATPDPLGVNQIPIGRSALRKTGDGFIFDHSYLDLLYVHPGKGVWAWHIVDGGADDTDGANGSSSIDVRKGVSIVNTSLPTEFAPGGTLVAIDFLTLQVMTVDPANLIVRGQQ